ncbi:GNAT family N-acetyltransferase [Ramlibacter sp. XY19]|uniref:GNAT family N-acetyltransferase n=1 Tax=Ramlibacter paludis TaxID=2908000 RepID=UPI0023DC5B41|nr:GNAT family N-acetyltransferase [Ramlibacter paludis]MCG2595741.1 GNAT family N-acetyltransferase [Ramlibacter paludis]
MAEFHLVPADRVDPQRLHAAFGAAFADYLIGPFQLAPSQWPQFLGRQAVDLGLSRVAVEGDAVLAFCFVAPRPAWRRWRLATMGAVPQARGTGVAPALLDEFIARAPGGVELECFAQNTRALRLYEGRGFAVRDALYGYTFTATASSPRRREPSAPALEDAFTWLDGRDLPLQVTGAALRALPVPLQAWREGSAQLVFSEAAERKVVIHSLVDGDAGQRDAQALVEALLGRYAEWTIHVPQLQRREVGGEALERLSFERLPLHQVWMMR